ncbi:uncharacterized protein LOC135199007 [Macrobrachium nipponense]|uniref:uncharacterized protein LOC135199007 n=1 Tax=Macrobrachium nipponense TaxID=159736 RepID=UPI0030C8C491
MQLIMPGKRKFRDAWINEDFQSWLKPVEGNPERASCRICHKELNAELTCIKRHNTSKTHLQNERAIDLGQLELEGNQIDSSTPIGVSTATILLACFIAENNLPFTTADKLVDLMKRMFPDSAIAQGLFMKRTKCTDVIRTMGKTVTNSLIKKLRTNKFSVIMDESTDVSTTKSCAVIVRFYDSHEQKITTAMLDLINVYDSNNAQGSTGENLYALLINTLTILYIPLLYLGAELHSLFQTESLKNRDMVQDVKYRCRQFCISVCVAVRKRFDLDNPLWEMVSFLSVSKALDYRSRIAMPSLQDLIKLVPRINAEDSQKLDDEWRSLDFVSVPDEIRHEKNIEEFYKGLGNLKDDEGHVMFSALSNFALHILSLPTSNADAERVFSKLNFIKTKLRNSLQLPSIIALIAVSEEVQRYGGCVQ